MKFVLAALIGLLVGSLALADPPTAHHRPTRPGAPANWNNVHHHRPHNVRPVAPVHTRRVVVNNYHLLHGHRFRFGFYYNGWNHNHWSYHYWDTRYGAYLYFDPYTTQYYYWCAPHFRFYPITYVPLGFTFPYQAAPTAPAVAPLPPPPVDPGLTPDPNPARVMPPAK